MTGHREKKEMSFLPVDRDDVIDDRSPRNKKDESFLPANRGDVIDDRSSRNK